jgi:uncharacterized coiled-coil protein SlyX
MIDLSSIQIIVGILSTLSVGGIIGFIVGLPYLRKREKAKMKQEVAQAANLELGNVRNLIELYNKALTDSKKFQEQAQIGYETRVNQLENQVHEYKNQVDRYSKTVKEYESTIDQLTRSQLKLKLQLQHISSLNNSECDKCQFRENCEKYKAKKLLDEQIDAKDLLSDDER